MSHKTICLDPCSHLDQDSLEEDPDGSFLVFKKKKKKLSKQTDEDVGWMVRENMSVFIKLAGLFVQCF